MNIAFYTKFVTPLGLTLLFRLYKRCRITMAETSKSGQGVVVHLHVLCIIPLPRLRTRGMAV